MSKKKDVSLIVSGAGFIGGFAHGLIKAMRRAGWSDERIHALVKEGELSDEMVNKIVSVLGQEAIGETASAKHIIDCDASPFTPEGWKVEEHRKNGQLEWDPKKVVLHLSDVQKKGGVISGNDLRKLLANEQVLNANVLDYLLANPHLIPEEWKGKAVFFWGTIFRHSDGNLCVRYLRWNGDRWHWLGYWLGDVWGSDGPAVRLAS